MDVHGSGKQCGTRTPTPTHLSDEVDVLHWIPRGDDQLPRRKPNLLKHAANRLHHLQGEAQVRGVRHDDIRTEANAPHPAQGMQAADI